MGFNPEDVQSQIAGKYDVKIDQYADWSLVLHLFTDAAHTIPMNLTNYVVEAQIRATKGGALLQAITSSVTGAPTLGIITLSLTSVQTGALLLRTVGYYDVVIYVPSGAKLRILEGACQLALGVTR